jgi:peptidoglycan hydrolase CwlO-like protein
MSKLIAIAVLTLLFASVAFAQQAQMSPEETQALLQSVAAQRDTANNQVAQLNAKLTVTMAELEKAKKDAEACKSKPEAKK